MLKPFIKVCVSKLHRTFMLKILLSVTLIPGGCAGLSGLHPTPTIDENPVKKTADVNSLPQAGALSQVNPRAAAVFAAATKALNQEDYVLAERLLLSLIEQYPEYSSARTNLALLLVNTDRVNEAIPLLKAAIAIEPRDCIPRIQLGLIERNRNNFLLAEQAYLGCLAEQPDNTVALIDLGILYELYMGRFEDAIAAYDRYQQLIDVPDQQVASWIANLSRRLKSMSQLASGEHYP